MNGCQLPLSEDPKAVALAFIERWPSMFRPEFRAWLEANWTIWLAFKQEADRIWARGRRHYAARTIIEWLRHETALQEQPVAEFKINGNFVPDLARLYLVFHPERDGFFELRHHHESEARAA
jgi:hypothetical protein